MHVRKLRDYKLMMADRVRMTAYQQAIAQVCKGRTVCEIGAGLGPLSLMALQAGARRVYGVELDPEALELATEVIRASGFGSDRFVPVLGLSTEIELPERVEVLLSETLDSMGVGENTATYMADAKTRLLTSDGVFLPGRLDCYAALASPETFEEETAFWSRELAGYGLDYGPALRQLRGVKHTMAVRSAELNSDWHRWQTIDFAAAAASTRFVPMALQATTEGAVQGLALAFDAALTNDVHLRTFPEDPQTHWQQGFVPFPQGPAQVDAGDLVYIELHFGDGHTPSLSWEMHVASGPPAAVAEHMKQRLAAMAGG
jgi:hypothetical protein